MIPNGFDLSRFRRSLKEESQELPDGVPAGRLAPCVGVFGRITRWKGQDVLLRALAKLPGVHGLIVGEALFTGDDRAFAGELRNLATELGIADRIHFTGFRRDIVPLLLSVDVVVHCSTSPEPFGRVIVEAMLSGRPLVATKAGGALEIVKHSETGLLVEPGNPDALARAINTLVENPPLASALGVSAQRDAQERFALERVLEQWRQSIKGIIALKR